MLYRLSYASEAGERSARGELARMSSRHPTEIGGKDNRKKEPDLASLFALNEREKALPPTPLRSASAREEGGPERTAHG